MAMQRLDPEDLMAHREVLAHPDDAAVREAFARLPKRGTITVTCTWERRLAVQQALAEMGAFAIGLRPFAAFDEIRVTASKGKVGACYETGRSATYTGAAMAVMDDDHHLIVGTIRVCEKTGGLYTLPPYHGLLTVTAGDPGLLARLETDPVPFDCNTFEPDAERLAAQPFVLSAAGEPTVPVFYPGPFSLLVLRDGTILRRGRCAQVAAGLVKDLQEQDGLLAVPPVCAREATQPVNYPSAYRSMGAGCLLALEPTAPAGPATDKADVGIAPLTRPGLTALDEVSESLRQRLLRLIKGDEPYFILTGSDPKDPLGCCPSAQVGEANHLVDVGVLSCYREAAVAADSCTTTIYAFTGEIRACGNRPEFSVNAARRREVAAALTRAQGRRRAARVGLKCLLVLLTVASFALAARRALASVRPIRDDFDTAMLRALNVDGDQSILVVCLFHGQETCAACQTMGRLCRQTVDRDFAALTRSGRLAFREIRYDGPACRVIRDRLGLFSTTVGLVQYGRGKPPAIRMLTQSVWNLWTDEAAFVRMLREHIRSMAPEAA